ELPDALIIEIPAAFLGLDGTPKSRRNTVPQFLLCPAVICRHLSIKARVVDIDRKTASSGAACIDAPERSSMIRRVIEEARFVQVRSSGEGVDIPRADRAHDFEAVEALADIRSLADGDESARSVVQLLPAHTECDPIFSRSAGLEERGLEVELLFVDRPWSSGPRGLQTAFQL